MYDYDIAVPGDARVAEKENNNNNNLLLIRRKYLYEYIQMRLTS